MCSPTKKNAAPYQVDTFKRGTFVFQFDSQYGLLLLTMAYISEHSSLLPRSNLDEALEQIAGDDEVLDIIFWYRSHIR